MEINIIGIGIHSLVEWLEENKCPNLDFSPIKSHGKKFGTISRLEKDIEIPLYMKEGEDIGSAKVYKDYGTLIYIQRNLYLVTWSY